MHIQPDVFLWFPLRQSDSFQSFNLTNRWYVLMKLEENKCSLGSHWETLLEYVLRGQASCDYSVMDICLIVSRWRRRLKAISNGTTLGMPGPWWSIFLVDMAFPTQPEDLEHHALEGLHRSFFSCQLFQLSNYRRTCALISSLLGIRPSCPNGTDRNMNMKKLTFVDPSLWLTLSVWGTGFIRRAGTLSVSLFLEEIQINLSVCDESVLVSKAAKSELFSHIWFPFIHGGATRQNKGLELRIMMDHDRWIRAYCMSTNLVREKSTICYSRLDRVWKHAVELKPKAQNMFIQLCAFLI